MVSLQGFTPLDYSRKTNDLLTMDVLLNFIRKEGQKFQTHKDLSLFMEKYRPSWASSYYFNKAVLSFDAEKMVKGGILGTINRGRDILYTTCQEINVAEMNKSINFKANRNMQIINIFTFNLRMNLEITTHLC